VREVRRLFSKQKPEKKKEKRWKYKEACVTPEKRRKKGRGMRTVQISAENRNSRNPFETPAEGKGRVQAKSRKRKWERYSSGEGFRNRHLS